MSEAERIAVLFDIDGTLLITGGAGAASWRLAFERRLFYLHQTVAESKDYRVLSGVEELLPKLIDDGYLLGLVTGNLDAAAHIKLHRAQLNRFFSFGGYGSDSTDRGELTRIALERATLVYGEPVTPEQAIVVGDTPARRRGSARRRHGLRRRRQPQLHRRPATRCRRRLRDRLAQRRSAAVSSENGRRRVPPDD
jgi:phosphoglycolate phosphatase-like HAD superfamily hydrolase